MAKKHSDPCDCDSVANAAGGEASVDAMFKALSDVTRLRILHLLLRGEACVGDLVTILEAPQPRVSQHLATLRSAGLVTCRREGLWSHYSLARPTATYHKKLIECLRHCRAEVAELQADDRRAAKLSKAARCCPPAPQRKRSLAVSRSPDSIDS